MSSPTLSTSSTDTPPLPPPITSSLPLENKPTAHLHYTFHPPSSSSPTRPNPFSHRLIVYLNGLLLPRTSWNPSISQFLQKRHASRLPYPALLTYDRYGQGDSDRDPDDNPEEPPPCHGHDIISTVHALKQFLLQIWKLHLLPTNPTSFPSLIFVSNSIGCAIARLFAQTYPGTVSGMLFLDSIIANSDFVSLWPDPDEKGFNPGSLPPGVTVEDVRATREKYARMFHPSVPNMEGLSRRNLATLLPSASEPKLTGSDGQAPYLTVVGHDWQTFAEQSWTGRLGTPKGLTMTYANVAWQKYNEGLVKITDRDKAIGPIVAVGCGHFVQVDGPGFVGDEVASLLDRVVNRGEQVRELDGGQERWNHP